MNRRHAAIDRPRRELTLALLAGTAAVAALPASVRAQGAGPAEGKDFTRIEPPQPGGTPGKVEVLEFFSYACPHCHSFEPALQAWARSLPPEVAFRRVPVSFLAAADTLQRTYYALEVNGWLESVHPRIFTALHVEKQRVQTPEDMAAIVGKAGGDTAKFLAAFKSFSVATQAGKAKKMVADYNIQSVPALAVGGRFLTSPSQAGGSERALAVAEQLVLRARKA